MNTRDPIDWEAVVAHYASKPAPKPITPDGLVIGSKKQLLRDSKPVRESKAARRLRRRALVG